MPARQHFKVNPYGIAQRIRISRLSTKALRRFESEQQGKVKRLKPITTGKFNSTHPGRIVVKRVTIRGKKTRRYEAAFDSDEERVHHISRGAATINPAHEPFHIRNEVFAHEHGFRRREFSALAMVEDLFFPTTIRPFNYNRNISQTLDGKPLFVGALREVFAHKNPRTMNKGLHEVLKLMEKSMRLEFHSKRAYMRAIIRLNRDPQMRLVMSRLNNIPVRVDASTDYKAFVQPRQFRRISHNIMRLYTFMRAQAAVERKKAGIV